MTDRTEKPVANTPEVAEKPKRRTFDAAYRLRIVEAAARRGRPECVELEEARPNTEASGFSDGRVGTSPARKRGTRRASKLLGPQKWTYYYHWQDMIRQTRRQPSLHER